MIALLRFRAVVAERQDVTFEACFNFRDLGGYKTADGRDVRRGCVYRSDTLHWMTAADARVVMDLGVRTIIDLRSTAEIEREGRFARADDVAYHHLPLYEEETRPFQLAAPDETEQTFAEAYLAVATAGAGQISAALRTIATADHAAVFHCTAGKDRTGVVASLVLSTLGVPDADIVADYHLSEAGSQRWLAWAEVTVPDVAAEARRAPAWVWTAPTTAMQGFLDLLHVRHGSVPGFLDSIGFESTFVETLRSRLITT